jgi:hypothetical protein
VVQQCAKRGCTARFWSCCVADCKPTFAVLSSDAVMRLLPSCEKLTHRTVPVCALRMVDLPSLYVQHRQHSMS